MNDIIGWEEDNFVSWKAIETKMNTYKESANYSDENNQIQLTR